MTLEELLKDKTLPVRVRSWNWESSKYFEVFFFDYDGSAFGKRHDGAAYYSRKDYDEWVIYKEPKPKVFLWESKDCFGKWVCGSTFRTEEEASKFFGTVEYRKSRLHTLGIYPKDGFDDE